MVKTRDDKVTMLSPFVASKDWYLEYIGTLIGYFNGLEQRHYLDGGYNKAVLELWQDLLERDVTDPKQVRELLMLLDSSDAFDGSVWLNIRYNVEHWEELVLAGTLVQKTDPGTGQGHYGE